MLHIIAGEESAAYDGALFAIFSHISFFDRRMGFSACRTGRGNKERNDNYMWRCSSFSLEFFHSASCVSRRFRSENTQPGER